MQSYEIGQKTNFYENINLYMSKAIDFLKKHESVSPSHFEENAKWRKENKERVKKSRMITITMLKRIEEFNITKKCWQKDI